MATYKAEFLARHYQGRLRPRHAFAFGLIPIWSRLASLAPSLANFFAQAPGFNSIAKWLAQVAPEREIPRFAPKTFKAWLRHRSPANQGRPKVILWADTFHNYFHPEVPQAALEVLEDAGFCVEVPEANLCCGRPLYDFGMLDTAKRWLRQILIELRPAIEAGTPLVVLEPSCCAVFRDELLNLFPGQLDARRLASNTFLLSEFLQQKAPDYQVPQLHRKALVHGHCHHKAVMGLKDEQSLLQRLGLDFHVLESGCCGMAGAFGYEKGEHYRVSVACAEQMLLPAVRQVDRETIIITNGFSCREQIAQGTDREPLHLAQVLQLGLRHGPKGLPGEPPEQAYVREREAAHRNANTRTAIALAGAAAIGLLAWKLWPTRRRKPLAIL